MMSKNPIIGIGLALVLASAAISLVLIEQKALAQTTNPCPELIAKVNAARAKLINDIQTLNFQTFSADLTAFIAAVNAAAAAGCLQT